MTKSRGILKPRIKYTDEQLAAIMARYPNERTDKIATDIGLTIEQVYRKAHGLGLAKSQEYLDSPEACRLRRGDNIGAQYRFKKGMVPPNKGIKGISYPGMEATQFKKGQKSHTWKPIGTERRSKEGYLQVKISDTGVSRHDYVPVHLLVWQLHHGDIPAKHRVAFKDGNKANIVIENLELVSFGEMMKRNTVHNYPKEIAQLVLLRGAVQRKINRRQRDERDNTNSTGQ
jgi:hypothetical protein